ncbi:NAD-dependent epimerase/dehydratase family protein [Pseudoalteromonas distincta]|uniref:NAD-dependent epimerase/dehydratase family protein n=1 Tax=Pseudoalteromonas distincta TaxID=77608 RepID=UPI0011F3D547|nr:NAD-dependent epimerase/dehydratase family protein [Pseudoalteromonas distincta]KAA1162953.1 NAD-dependent epimerase/dehydratase family protein [Pseudoalteromonas distincta]
MRCLVLGANGFIGSHLVDSLVDEFEYAGSFARSKYKYNTKCVESFIGDFKDIKALEASLIGHDCVVHSISSSTPSVASKDPILDIENNILPTIKLIDAMVTVGVERLVYISSGGTVYGDPDKLPIIEESMLNPISIYGVTKVAIEKYIQVLCQQNGINLTIFRPSNPFGPRQTSSGNQGLIATLLESSITNKPIDVYDSGNAVRDFIFIDDLSKAIMLAVRNNISGVFNIGFGKGYSVKEVISTIERITQYEFVKNNLPKRSFDINEVVLDIMKARTELKWQPKVDIVEGINSHFDWLLKSGFHK